MVRILTTHRVFPAKVTGGNGIAGTLRTTLLVKEYALACGAAMVYIKGFLVSFDGRRVVGPGIFQVMSQ